MEAKFGELGAEIRAMGPKTSSGVGMGSPGRQYHTPLTGGLQKPGLVEVLERYREIERVLGGDGTQAGMVHLTELRLESKHIDKLPEPGERDLFDNGFVEANRCVKDFWIYGAEMSPNRLASS